LAKKIAPAAARPIRETGGAFVVVQAPDVGGQVSRPRRASHRFSSINLRDVSRK
jgi:hypothetical protein